MHFAGKMGVGGQKMYHDGNQNVEPSHEAGKISKETVKKTQGENAGSGN